MTESTLKNPRTRLVLIVAGIVIAVAVVWNVMEPSDDAKYEAMWGKRPTAAQVQAADAKYDYPSDSVDPAVQRWRCHKLEDKPVSKLSTRNLRDLDACQALGF